MIEQPARKIILSLQTMRLFASLSVFQYHLWHNYFNITFFHPGTDFFLVLVGAVAALTQAKRIPTSGWKKYIQGRYIRLYVTYIPLFILVLIVKWSEFDLDWAMRSFFFIPIVDPNRLPVIGASWMLSRFMLFYFIFSLAFLFKREQVLYPLFALWAASIIAFNCFDWQFGLPSYWAEAIFSERNLDFLFGYLVGVLVRTNRFSVHQGRWIFWLGMISVVGGTIWMNRVGDSLGRSLYIGIPVTLFVLGLTTLEKQNAPDGIVNLLTRPWLVWLGATSYVLYLSHGIFLQIWDRLLPMHPLLVPLITFGGILVAAIGYHYWEEPLLQYFSKRPAVHRLRSGPLDQKLSDSDQ